MNHDRALAIAQAVTDLRAECVTLRVDANRADARSMRILAGDLRALATRLEGLAQTLANAGREGRPA